MKDFLPLLKLKSVEEFIWGKEQQKAFDQIKESLASSLGLTPLALDRLLKLYTLTICNLLAQDAEDGTEKVIYYLSQLLNDVETRYTPIEKFYLS